MSQATRNDKNWPIDVNSCLVVLSSRGRLATQELWSWIKIDENEKRTAGDPLSSGALGTFLHHAEYVITHPIKSSDLVITNFMSIYFNIVNFYPISNLNPAA